MNPTAIAARSRLDFEFFRKGIVIAILSRMFYETYIAFMTFAMSFGIWGGGYGDNAGFSGNAVIFLLNALGAATTTVAVHYGH